MMIAKLFCFILFVHCPIFYGCRALQFGAQVTESNIDYERNSGDMCVIEGPEGIIVHVFSNGKTGALISPCELVMKALLSKPEHDDDRKASSPPESASGPSGVSNPRPLIRTLDVGLQSDYHPLGFISCPPNSRKAIPFETEVLSFNIIIKFIKKKLFLCPFIKSFQLFKGVAMIIVRTNPIDAHYAAFFEDKRLIRSHIRRYSII